MTAWLLISIILATVSVQVRGEGISPLLNTKDPQAVMADLQNFIPPLLEKGRVPGLQIALVRDGGTFSEYRLLTAVSKDTFILEVLATFRLKIEFDEKGNPVKIVGLHADGSKDQTIRDK